MNILSFDVGGTTIKAGLVNKDLEIQEKFTKDTPKNEESFISLIEEIHKVRTDKCDKVSFGMPGFVDRDNYVFKYGTNMKFSIDFKKLEFFDEKKLYIENDGNLAAYSEFVLNLSDKYKNVIMLTFGTGIGGGIILEGKLYRGAGSAGELGHILVSDNQNNICNCGKTGCLESIVSARVWTEKCNELNIIDKSSELSKAYDKLGIGSIIFDKSIKLTPKELEVRENLLFYLSRGFVSIFEIFNNDIFLLGGAMADNPYDLKSLLNEYLEDNYKFEARRFPLIEISNFKSDSGLLGAAILALNE